MKQLFAILFVLLCANISYSQCFPDRHNTSWKDAWVSCDQSANPNPIRGESHWIRFNFNNVYALGQMTYWNFNDPSYVNYGLREVFIDYTVDGIEWTEWGSYSFDMSEGSAFYEGTAGPDLDGIEAKDILITAVTNHGGECFALSEIKIEVLGLVSSTDEVLDITLTLSPVPTSDLLTVEMGSEDINGALKYNIIDIDGKQFQSGVFEKTANVFNQNLDVSQMPAGQYFLEIRSKDKNASKPFTIIRK